MSYDKNNFNYDVRICRQCVKYVDSNLLKILHTIYVNEDGRISQWYWNQYLKPCENLSICCIRWQTKIK